MGGLSQQASKFHRHILSKIHHKTDKLDELIPENQPVQTIVMGLFSAWKKFDDESAIVLVVVDDVNQNQMDQRFVEYELEKMSKGRIRSVRLTFLECSKR